MDLTFIIQNLTRINEFINRVVTNSKRIDELPAATTGGKYVAVWNEDEGENGQSQKQSREDFVDQNNIGRRIDLGPFTQPGAIAEAVSQVNETYGFSITEKQTPVVLNAIKFMPPPGVSEPGNYTFVPTYRYTFLFLGGKGNWGANGEDINANMLYMLPPENLQPADIAPSDTTNITALGDIGNDTNFLPTVNLANYDFTDDGIQNYFTYTVDDVLTLVMFIGEPGEYGADGTEFQEEDFAYITNSDTEPGPALQNYDSVLGQGNVTSRLAIHLFGGQKTKYGYYGFDYSGTGFNAISVGFRDPAAGGPSKIYFPAGRNEENILTESDLLGVGFRIDDKQIKKLGKGYIETEEGITYNTGPFSLHEKGDRFFAIDGDGGFIMPMRYYGPETNVMPTTLDNMAFETRVKVKIPGEPGYEAPE